MELAVDLMGIGGVIILQSGWDLGSQKGKSAHHNTSPIHPPHPIHPIFLAEVLSAVGREIVTN